MKKIIYICLDLLTIAFLIGGYAFQYFTRKKLGMLRWVNYQNMQLQKNHVYDILKYITVAAAMVLIVLIIVGYRILGIIYLGITVLKSIESFSAYYFLMPFLGAATLMQIIRNGIAVGTKKNEK